MNNVLETVHIYKQKNKIYKISKKSELIWFDFHHRQVGSVNEIVYRKKKMNRRLLIKHMPSIYLNTDDNKSGQQARD